MRSISEIEALARKYIMKTTPANMPLVGKYFHAYICAMLGSSSIREALDELHRYTTNDPDPESLNRLSVLRDFCSSVGVPYEPRYEEAILRSLVSKDEDFLVWFGEKFLGGAKVTLLRGGSYESDEIVETTDVPGARLDAGLFTDMSVRSLFMATFSFSVTKEEAIPYIENVIDFLWLVLPARLPVMFRFYEEAVLLDDTLDNMFSVTNEIEYDYDYDQMHPDTPDDDYEVIVEEGGL